MTEKINKYCKSALWLLLYCISTVCSIVYTLPALLLQKPHTKSKEHIACLKRRLSLWDNGNIVELVKEGSESSDQCEAQSFVGIQMMMPRWHANSPI